MAGNKSQKWDRKSSEPRVAGMSWLLLLQGKIFGVHGVGLICQERYFTRLPRGSLTQLKESKRENDDESV